MYQIYTVDQRLWVEFKLEKMHKFALIDHFVWIVFSAGVRWHRQSNQNFELPIRIVLPCIRIWNLHLNFEAAFFAISFCCVCDWIQRDQSWIVHTLNLHWQNEKCFGVPIFFPHADWLIWFFAVSQFDCANTLTHDEGAVFIRTFGSIYKQLYEYKSNQIILCMKNWAFSLIVNTCGVWYRCIVWIGQIELFKLKRHV